MYWRFLASKFKVQFYQMRFYFFHYYFSHILNSKRSIAIWILFLKTSMKCFTNVALRPPFWKKILYFRSFTILNSGTVHFHVAFYDTDFLQCSAMITNEKLNILKHTFMSTFSLIFMSWTYFRNKYRMRLTGHSL